MSGLAAAQPELYTGGRAAGSSFSAGLATGIYSGKSGVIQAAINVAKAAITAANQTLEINSPSKATMRSGRSFGEGFPATPSPISHAGIIASMVDRRKVWVIFLLLFCILPPYPVVF